ncbi:membrane protein [Mycolicibacterium cyprinidarum]|uniref:Membrane protein n=1 Tax=Mycolicibacterium cyprinidarum TaxID=2860311 RepID=A0ABQ4VD67_9MYCO|nr:membrane protein [Mycolicibacterium sp. NGTWS0302]GJF18897.1 membrane protein [Mycolicibacterium sp. NGTWSNA01]
MSGIITATHPANAVSAQVDVRGPRFVAWVTTVVLVATLLTSTSSAVVAATILSLQTVVFAIGAALGPRRHPYGLVFATLIAPRLGPVTEREPAAPLKFAQLVGFLFAAVGVVGLFSGLSLLGLVATGLALVAALLNAAFGICLGCQLYPLVARHRLTRRASTT